MIQHTYRDIHNTFRWLDSGFWYFGFFVFCCHSVFVHLHVMCLSLCSPLRFSVLFLAVWRWNDLMYFFALFFFPLSFLALWLCVYHEIWKILGYFFFKYIFCLPILFSPLGIPITHALDYLILTVTLECSLLFPPLIICSLCVCFSWLKYFCWLTIKFTDSFFHFVSCLMSHWRHFSNILLCFSFLAFPFDSFSFYFCVNTNYVILHGFHFSVRAFSILISVTVNSLSGNLISVSYGRLILWIALSHGSVCFFLLVPMLCNFLLKIEYLE